MVLAPFAWPPEGRRWPSGHGLCQQSSALEMSLSSQVLPSVLMQPASVQTLGTRVPMSLHLCRDAVVPDKVKKLVLKGCFLF